MIKKSFKQLDILYKTHCTYMTLKNRIYIQYQKNNNIQISIKIKFNIPESETKLSPTSLK